MGRLADRLGDLDDATVIYRADDPAQKIAWRRLVLAKIVGWLFATACLAGASLVIDDGLAAVALLLVTIVFSVTYVIWRRRRNKRLTGSPTKWPSP